MALTDSPYRSPVASDTHAAQERRDTNPRFESAGLVVFPLFGGLIGFAGFIAAAMLIESQSPPTGPTLSYGQQAGLISLPICTIVGVGIGFGVALSIVRRRLISIFVLMAVGLLGSAVVVSMWSDQIARYGRDPSEVVLYYPPMAACAIALVVAGVVACIAGVAHIRRRRHVTKR